MSRIIKNEVGKLGEDIAKMLFVKRGFKLIDQNFNTYFGEIDLVVQKNKKIHFVEVKAVYYSKSDLFSRETATNGLKYSYFTGIRPEENVTREKIRKLEKTIGIYLTKYDILSCDWQLDLLAIYIPKDVNKRHLRFGSLEEGRIYLNYIENVCL